MLLVCPHCWTKNRVADDRVGEKPTCGRCQAELLPSYPITLGDQTLAHYIQHTEMPIVVDFWASWCGPCLNFAPVFNQAAAELESKFRFAKVNTEQQQQLAAQFQIRSIPTLMLFKAGKLVTQQSGAMPKQMFYQWLQQYS